MRCRLAEARVSWGKEETDGALRAARAVATRLRGRVEGGGGSRGLAAPPAVVVAVDGREREEQRILSEVCLMIRGLGQSGALERGAGRSVRSVLKLMCVCTSYRIFAPFVFPPCPCATWPLSSLLVVVLSWTFTRGG